MEEPKLREDQLQGQNYSRNVLKKLLVNTSSEHMYKETMPFEVIENCLAGSAVPG